MRYVTKELHTEIHPESAEDFAELREKYPQHWPFQYICLADGNREGWTIKTKHKSDTRRTP